ncbi:hypothetical protein ABBQ32_008039 [Trebouxia sp. C0010 RCD-2024]
MKRTAGVTGSPSPIAACRSHRCTTALLVVTILLTSGVVAARDFPAEALPSETSPAPSQRNESAAELQANPAFSLSLDAYHSQGLRRHSRSLKQSSCPNAASASSTCQSVSKSQVNSWRNVLVSQCSNVIPASSGSGGCCSGLPSPGTPAWTNFISCAW